ncbi:MAG: LPS export ABC transporter permease LptF [Desulfobacterales bacterium]
MPSLISRYVVSELIPPFAVNLLFFTFVFIMAKLLKIIDLIVNYRAGMGVVGLILLYTLPQFLMFIFPMATMMSVLLTLLRMSGDQEIVALKAGGVGVHRLIPPVMVFCVMGCLLTLAMTLYGKPWSKYAVKQLTYRLAVSSFDAALKERSFIGQFEGMMLYISEADIQKRELRDVFIEDSRNPDLVVTIVAPRGRLVREPGSPVVRLRLYSGSIFQANPKNRSASQVQYETYDLTLDLEQMVGPPRRQKKDDEMYPDELFSYLDSFEKKEKRYFKALNELHIKFSIPFASVALGLIAIPLGLQLKSARKSAGLGMGIVVFLLYYVLMTIGLVLGEEGALSPLIGLWIPNLLILGAGGWLMFNTAKERPMPGSDALDRIISGLHTRFLRFRRDRRGEGSDGIPPACPG